jgi:hypothetical protein
MSVFDKYKPISPSPVAQPSGATVFSKYKPVATGGALPSINDPEAILKTQYGYGDENIARLKQGGVNLASEIGNAKRMQQERANYAQQSRFYSGVAKGVGSAAAGASQGIYEGVGNTLAAAGQAADLYTNYATPTGVANRIMGAPQNTAGADAGKYLQNASKQLSSGIGETATSQLGADMNSAPAAFGRFIGGTAAQVPGMLAGGALANKLSTAAPGVVSWGRNLGATIAGGAVNTITGKAATTGQLPTANDFSTGAMYDAGLYGLGTLAKGIGKTVYKAGLNVKGETIGQGTRRLENAMNSKLTGSPQTIERKANKVLAKAGEELQGIVSKSKVVTPIEDLTNDAVEAAVRATKMGDQAKAKAIMAKIDAFKQANKAGIASDELLDMSRYSGKEIQSSLKKADLGNTAASASKIFNESIYKNSKDVINKISKRAKVLNGQMEGAFAAKDAATKVYNRGANPSILQPLTWAPSIGTNIMTRVGAGINQVRKALPAAAAILKQQEIKKRTKVLK